MALHQTPLYFLISSELWQGGGKFDAYLAPGKTICDHAFNSTAIPIAYGETLMELDS